MRLTRPPPLSSLSGKRPEGKSAEEPAQPGFFPCFKYSTQKEPADRGGDDSAPIGFFGTGGAMIRGQGVWSSRKPAGAAAAPAVWIIMTKGTGRSTQGCRGRAVY